MKFKIEDIVRSLIVLDLGCDFIEKSYNTSDRIWFQNESFSDPEVYLELRFYKYYAKINLGYLITKEERAIVFPYHGYDDVDDYADSIAKFVLKYFKSFKLVRTFKTVRE